MHYRVRKAIKKGKKWSSIYCKYRFKTKPKIGDEKFESFVKKWGDGSYIILDDRSKYIESIKVDNLGYRRRANKRGQIIKPSKFPSKHQRVPECSDCYKKGFLAGVKKTRERAIKVIEKRNKLITQLKKQISDLSRSPTEQMPTQFQVDAVDQISEINENKSSKQIAEEENNRKYIEETEEEAVKNINCPSCGFRVSTNESRCPRCGFDPEEEDVELEEEDVEIVECPSCGTRVSTKEPCCPRCGFDPEEEDEEYEEEDVEIIECPSCGARISTKEPRCPRCGFDPEEEDEEDEENEDENEYL